MKNRKRCGGEAPATGKIFEYLNENDAFLCYNFRNLTGGGGGGGMAPLPNFKFTKMFKISGSRRFTKTTVPPKSPRGAAPVPEYSKSL